MDGNDCKNLTHCCNKLSKQRQTKVKIHISSYGSTSRPTVTEGSDHFIACVVCPYERTDTSS